MTINYVSGKKYRILVDAVREVWDQLSFWTKASDVEFEDGSTLEGKVFGNAMVERSHTFNVGDIVYCASAPSWAQFKCIVAGTTASVEPAEYALITDVGMEVVDGTATFVSYDVRPEETLGKSKYIIPSSAAVDDALAGVRLAFDASGNLGYKKDGADTVIPFRYPFYVRHVHGAACLSAQCDIYINHAHWSEDEGTNIGSWQCRTHGGGGSYQDRYHQSAVEAQITNAINSHKAKIARDPANRKCGIEHDDGWVRKLYDVYDMIPGADTVLTREEADEYERTHPNGE